MPQQIPLSEQAIADFRTEGDEDVRQISLDLGYLRLAMVNVVLFGFAGCGDRRWVLIDTGVPGFAGRIQRAAARRFGDGARPSAIVMTHGHFDHIGNLEKLAAEWEVPIYAHEEELQYLNGTTAYPPPDITVGGGLMPLLAPLFPRGPINVGRRLLPLPADGSIPGMPAWRWIHTPGHTRGHVSLWQEGGRILIAGDAFITTAQESAYAVITQEPEMHGPPKYFTPNWTAARRSVQALARLKPELVVTGHGRAMRGPRMLAALEALAADFIRVAVPQDRQAEELRKLSQETPGTPPNERSPKQENL